MPQRDTSFQTSDHVTLRGWFFTPEATTGKLPCLIMSHGWCGLKEMDLDTFAKFFISKLQIACLVYDNRGFGASDQKDGQPRLEIVPELQRSDYQDAITHAQSLPEVDADKIGLWGSSYSGGHVIQVGAIDRRVKAVVCQVPMLDGWQTFHRLVRPDLLAGMNAGFNQDRLARARGDAAIKIPVVDADTTKPSALPTPDSYEFFAGVMKKLDWKNEVTIKSVELLRANDPSHMIHRISPTPLFMSVAENDVLCPTDIAIEAYSRAREPKQLHILPGGHFDAYSGETFQLNAARQVQFLKDTLCSSALALR